MYSFSWKICLAMQSYGLKMILRKKITENMNRINTYYENHNLIDGFTGSSLIALY